MKYAKCLAALAVVASTAYSQALVAYDNFGPGDTFDVTSGWGDSWLDKCPRVGPV